MYCQLMLLTHVACWLCHLASRRGAGIHAIYSGHDHDNDFAVELEGVRLAYGRKTG